MLPPLPPDAPELPEVNCLRACIAAALYVHLSTDPHFITPKTLNVETQHLTYLPIAPADIFPALPCS